MMMPPHRYRIDSIEADTNDVFTLTLTNHDGGGGMVFAPGQFNMLYQFGFGEVAISISGNPSKNDILVHTIRSVGSVTHRMQKLKPGEEIGVRGPFGNPWPLSKKNCDVLVVAGGIGLAPLRPALYYLADHRSDYRKITLLYGSRTPHDILFQKDIRQWKQQGMDIELTVDYADMEWNGQVGVVTPLIRKHMPDPKNTLVLICGPEIMIQFAINECLRANADENLIYISMERNMQCAVGFCGHCQYGPYFLCKDGPVFCYAQVKSLLTIKEL